MLLLLLLMVVRLACSITARGSCEARSGHVLDVLSGLRAGGDDRAAAVARHGLMLHEGLVDVQYVILSEHDRWTTRAMVVCHAAGEHDVRTCQGVAHKAETDGGWHLGRYCGQ